MSYLRREWTCSSHTYRTSCVGTLAGVSCQLRGPGLETTDAVTILIGREQFVHGQT